MRYKVIGPPGTGKTRRLLNEVENYVNKGTKLNKIGYFAFTRKAAGRVSNVSVSNSNTNSLVLEIRYEDVNISSTR